MCCPGLCGFIMEDAKTVGAEPAATDGWWWSSTQVKARLGEVGVRKTVMVTEALKTLEG